MGYPLKRGLAQQIASEELPRLHPTTFQELDDLRPAERCIFPYLDQKTKPRRLTVSNGPGQNQKFLIGPQSTDKPFVIGAPGRDKRVQFAQLLPPDGRLDIERLQVVPEMTVNVFVVISGRQTAELPFEPFPTGIVLAGSAPTVPAPVPERFCDPFQPAAIRKDGAAFAHRQMVGRVKTLGRQVAERP